ncbi:MAG TPA: hypothetical protein PK109_01945 [Candidatus Paceibacterota bacterium]|nr:hypothetical protein [Candidatus Paceibacterota bacterium]
MKYEADGHHTGGPGARKESASGIEELSEGVVIDQKVLAWIYKNVHGKDVHAIATDQFLNKSRDNYGPPWLVRELVQNFVDHNETSPGTLNGVECIKTNLKDGGVRFEIKGHWKYRDSTGVLSPHSEKPKDAKTAGGNGIGLKQTAIRFLRDFGVDTFEIHGEQWAVKYRLARANVMNALLKQQMAVNQTPAVEVKHDWLIGEMEKTQNSGECRYIIETKDPAVIAALDTFQTLGVSKDNEFLKNPDFKNRYGAIKWITPSAEFKEKMQGKRPLPKNSDDDEIVRRPYGRLYINGQVMNYSSKGKTDETYWQGLDFMTLELDNIDYEMSVDRPPVASYLLPRYARDLVNSMTKEDILEQLRRSEPIWSLMMTGGWAPIVESMVLRLKQYGVSSANDFAALFPGKKYLAANADFSSEQRRKFVEEDGYTLCPGFFSDIGMQAVSTLLSESEQIRRNSKANTYDVSKAMEKLAAETGIQVLAPAYEVKTASQFAALIKERLIPSAVAFDFDDSTNSMRITFAQDCPDALILNPLASPEGSSSETLMHALRGCIRSGLATRILSLDTCPMVSNKELSGIYSINEISIFNPPLFMKTKRMVGDKSWTADFSINETYYSTIKAAMNGVELPEPPEPIRTSPSQTLPSGAKASQRASVPEQARPIVRKAEMIPAPEDIPGLSEAVDSLEKIAEKKGKKKIGSLIGQYLSLRGKEEAKKTLASGAGYLTGISLREILAGTSEADIAPAIDRRSEMSRRLQSAIDRLDEDDRVDNFEIVLEPSEGQLAQLSLLREYVHRTTGAAFSNDLFVFTGDGAKGVNISQEAIGVHAEVLNVSFGEALEVMFHELAHNAYMNHSSEFMSQMMSLSMRSQENVMELLEKSERREKLTPEERFVLTVRKEWSALQTGKKVKRRK